MSEIIKIQLNSLKNVNSVNVDQKILIELKNNVFESDGYEINSSVNSSDVFSSEREESEKYRIYGRIEFFSLLNGLPFSYTDIDQLFYKSNDANKTIFNTFDFYLVKPSLSSIVKNISGYTKTYYRYFDIIAKPENFDIFSAGYSNNLFNDEIYQFNVNIDVDLENVSDIENFPLDEIYIYAKYKNTGSETLSSIYFKPNGGYILADISVSGATVTSPIYGDLITYDFENYNKNIVSGQTYFITTTFATGGTVTWKYNPFIPIKIKYLSNSLNSGSIDNDSYTITNNIPKHAYKLKDSIYVWRDILSKGVFDPISGNGVNFPFVNNSNYVFNDIILDITPDTENEFTKNVFNNLILKTKNDFVNPTNNLDNLGKPCQ